MGLTKLRLKHKFLLQDMIRRFFILSRFKMPTLRSGPGDLLFEDIIDIASDKFTRILDKEADIREVQARHPELQYCFVFETKQYPLKRML